MKKIIIILLLFLNLIVLLGQIWPEGAPPFAKTIDILFLIGTFLYLISHLVNYKKPS